jgi:hypothetical protein
MSLFIILKLYFFLSLLRFSLTKECKRVFTKKVYTIELNKYKQQI